MVDWIPTCGERSLQLDLHEHLEKAGRLDPRVWFGVTAAGPP